MEPIAAPQPHQFSPEQTAEHIRGLHEVTGIINRLISENVKTPETLDEMDRCVRHNAHMCAMHHIKESGEDLTPFTDAAAAGIEWMA